MKTDDSFVGYAGEAYTESSIYREQHIQRAINSGFIFATVNSAMCETSDIFMIH